MENQIASSYSSSSFIFKMKFFLTLHSCPSPPSPLGFFSIFSEIPATGLALGIHCRNTKMTLFLVLPSKCSQPSRERRDSV